MGHGVCAMIHYPYIMPSIYVVHLCPTVGADPVRSYPDLTDSDLTGPYGIGLGRVGPDPPDPVGSDQIWWSYMSCILHLDAHFEIRLDVI